MLGWLVGGAIVWGVRIFGTLAFGREAMGLGDVHLLASMGAAFGWFDPLLAFFIAPFFGLIWILIGQFGSRVFKGLGHQLPYGPHLAIALFSDRLPSAGGLRARRYFSAPDSKGCPPSGLRISPPNG